MNEGEKWEASCMHEKFINAIEVLKEIWEDKDNTIETLHDSIKELKEITQSAYSKINDLEKEVHDLQNNTKKEVKSERP